MIMMDSLFSIVVGIAGFFGGITILNLHTRMSRLEADLSVHKSDFAAHKTVMAERYVPKDDYRSDMAEIKDSIKEVISILHRKQDRHSFDEQGRPRFE